MDVKFDTKNDPFALFLKEGNKVTSSKAASKTSSKVSSKVSGNGVVFPAGVFSRRGAVVSQVGKNRWLVNFMRGKFVSFKIDETYIYRILNDFTSELINPGDIAWDVEEVVNGKFLIKRVA
jgi:hypothetical protein